MRNKAKVLFFLFGLGAFAFLLWKFGLGQLALYIDKAGWTLVYVIGVWFLIYVLNAFAWKLALGSRGNDVSFPRLFTVTVSGFVLNYVTPVVAIGGEPYKVKALGGVMDTSRSLSSVVLYRMVHLLGHMLLLLTGIIGALVSLPLSRVAMIIFGVVGVVILGVIIVTLAGHRGGIFQRLNRFMERVPRLRRAARALGRYEENLSEMDEVITNAYHHYRGRFYVSIAVEYLSRALMGVEVFLILQGIGIETTMVSSLFLYVVYSIIINIWFFIPLNLGAREGGLVLGLEMLTISPLLGVYLGVVMRVREFFWILLGLLFILLSGSRKKIPSPQAP